MGAGVRSGCGRGVRSCGGSEEWVWVEEWVYGDKSEREAVQVSSHTQGSLPSCMS